MKVHGKSIVELSRLTIAEARAFLSGMPLAPQEELVARELLKEIDSRLGFLLDVGLGYLTLDRTATTLSGGESQRIRLASQIGSELTGVIYILDEPSIGLHQRDNGKLLTTLKRLRDLGNSVIVVEHDEETMEEADWIVDFGPGAGELGGTIVAQGTPAEVMANPRSLTGAYLSGREEIEIPDPPPEPRQGQAGGRGGEGEQPQEPHRGVPHRPAGGGDRGERRGQVDAGERDPLSGARPATEREPGGAGAAQGDRRASSTWTRSSTSTSAPSGGRRAATRRPTPRCSTRSARSSP